MPAKSLPTLPGDPGIPTTLRFFKRGHDPWNRGVGRRRGARDQGRSRVGCGGEPPCSGGTAPPPCRIVSNPGWPFTGVGAVAVLSTVRVRGIRQWDDHWCFRLRTLASLHSAQPNPRLTLWFLRAA